MFHGKQPFLHDHFRSCQKQHRHQHSTVFKSPMPHAV